MNLFLIFARRAAARIYVTPAFILLILGTAKGMAGDEWIAGAVIFEIVWYAEAGRKE